MRMGGINVAKILPQHMPREFGKCPGQFNARWATAHDHDGHQGPLVFQRHRRFRVFKCEQNSAANQNRIGKRFQARRKTFPFVMAEITRATAERQHEIVIIQFALGQYNLLRIEFNIRHFVEQHGEVGPVTKNRTNGLGDVRRGKAGGGDLVKQWLKEVMIGAVNERYSRVRVLKSLAKFQATKPAAQHHDMGMFICRHSPMFRGNGKKSMA